MLRSPPGLALGAGMLALNGVALAAGSPISPAEELPPSALEETPFPRALSTSVFGFETILTGLVYLSFGIFLYQMIQRAVDARLITSLTSPSGGRSASQFDVGALLQSLEEIPDVASEMALVGVKGLEVWSQRPSCLPLFLCRANSPHSHQRSRQPALALTSSAVTLWAGLQNPNAILEGALATWRGAKGYACDDAYLQCYAPHRLKSLD